MIGAWVRFAAAVVCMALGLVFMVSAVIGVNRFHHALKRMHAAALGDTMGILFVILSLMIMKGPSMDSLKLFMVIVFFWIASPVSGHMISRLEAMTDESLGELSVMEKSSGVHVKVHEVTRPEKKGSDKKKKQKKGGESR
ncbi:MAG: monovalent cation/H(+) antiporter subunit G [Hungatella sp.]|nr:monovalent cation/H(+) antiporter subunit G [Hungatella sp.]